MEIKYRLNKEDCMYLYKKFLFKIILIRKIVPVYILLLFFFVSIIIISSRQGRLQDSTIILAIFLSIIVPIILIKMVSFKFEKSLKDDSSMLKESILRIYDEVLEITKIDEKGVICEQLRINKDKIYSIYEDEKCIYILRDKSILIQGVPKRFMNLDQIKEILDLSKYEKNN